MYKVGKSTDRHDCTTWSSQKKLLSSRVVNSSPTMASPSVFHMFWTRRSLETKVKYNTGNLACEIQEFSEWHLCDKCCGCLILADKICWLVKYSYILETKPCSCQTDYLNGSRYIACTSELSSVQQRQPSEKRFQIFLDAQAVFLLLSLGLCFDQEIMQVFFPQFPEAWSNMVRCKTIWRGKVFPIPEIIGQAEARNTT